MSEQRTLKLKCRSRRSWVQTPLPMTGLRRGNRLRHLSDWLGWVELFPGTEIQLAPRLVETILGFRPRCLRAPSSNFSPRQRCAQL